MKHAHGFPWSDQSVARLGELADEGLSTRQIAGELSAEFGHVVGKHAVIGKMHRTGMNGKLHHPSKQPPNAPRRPRYSPRHRKPVVAPPIVPVEPLPEPDAVTSTACGLMQLDDSRCRWPVGEAHGLAQAFCGAQPVEGRPYCAGHGRLSYVPVARRDGRIGWAEKRAASRWGASGPRV